MGSAGLLGDWMGVRQVFYLAGGITLFASLLAALLMRTPKPTAEPLAVRQTAD